VIVGAATPVWLAVTPTDDDDASLKVAMVPTPMPLVAVGPVNGVPLLAVAVRSTAVAAVIAGPVPADTEPLKVKVVDPESLGGFGRTYLNWSLELQFALDCNVVVPGVTVAPPLSLAVTVGAAVKPRVLFTLVLVAQIAVMADVLLDRPKVR
jgi:hypothetical protein